MSTSETVPVGEQPSDATFTTLAWVRGNATSWVPSLVRVLETPGLHRLVVALDGPRGRDLIPHDDRLDVVVAHSFRDTVRDVARTSTTPLLVLTGPVLLPTTGIQPALTALADDARVASVSFLSNAAGYLSFPHRNSPTQFSVEGFDETTLTRRLRESDPVAELTPVVAPSGAATLVSRDCVVVTNGPDDEFAGEPAVAVLEMVVRASRRGLRAVLDPSTYVTRVWEGHHWGADPLDDPLHRSRINELHPFVVPMHDAVRASTRSPLGLALTSARAKVRGLRVLIDASCLGPIETGTQVQTLSLIGALARREDVSWIGVGMGGPPPRYAEEVLAHPKIEVIRTVEDRFRNLPRADVLHRPFQPHGGLPYQNWHRAADRVVVTLQDLIAYGLGAYHDDGPTWQKYRRGIRQSVAKADGLVVISHDVFADLAREKLPVIAERTFVVENGTDHLTGDEPDQFPTELMARGWAARDFLVVLGANYSHKNRDLAVRAFRLLRERHPSLGLVLAGVAVAEGSSRVLEAIETADLDGVVTLPDVSAEERNWLLRHASICLYPTSAEGFGLVPFEAARFGTPTVHTRFGPLAEVLDGVPVVAQSWDPEAFAAACELLLSDPHLAAEQVEATLKSGTRYTWEQTAASLVTAYRGLLAEPPR